MGPLYSAPWYFSASLMQVVWPLYCAGPAKVVLQSRQVKDDWQDMRCLSSLGFFTVSPHAR